MRSANEMRIGLGQFSELTDEKLAFIKQLGADDFLMNTPDLPGTARWELADLVALRERADAAELRLMCLENVPVTFYDKAMLGLPGRDEQIEHMQATIRNMGRAGIPILGYHWMPNQVWRSPERERLRGGALATRFDMAEHGDAPLTHGRVFDRGRDVGQLRVLPARDPAGRRGGGRHPGAAPGRSAGAVAGRRGAHLPQLRRLQARHRHVRQPQPRTGLLHGLLVGDGAQRRERSEPHSQSAGRGAPLRRPGPDRLRALPRRAGRGAVLQRVLHRRRQPGHFRGGAGVAARWASPAS